MGLNQSHEKQYIAKHYYILSGNLPLTNDMYDLIKFENSINDEIEMSCQLNYKGICLPKEIKSYLNTFELIRNISEILSIYQKEIKDICIDSNQLVISYKTLKKVTFSDIVAVSIIDDTIHSEFITGF